MCTHCANEMGVEQMPSTKSTLASYGVDGEGGGDGGGKAGGAGGGGDGDVGAPPPHLQQLANELKNELFAVLHVLMPATPVMSAQMSATVKVPTTMSLALTSVHGSAGGGGVIGGGSSGAGGRLGGGSAGGPCPPPPHTQQRADESNTSGSPPHAAVVPIDWAVSSTNAQE